MRPVHKPKGRTQVTAATELLDRAVEGDRRALARLLTRIENADPPTRELLPQVFSATRGAHLVGITGPPGAGKSTLVTALAREYRKRGRRVGIVAVDPSSPYTGGAIMGDRIRMMEHSADRDVFMRSMASRGELGGIAASTWLVAAALDAAGYDPVLVETVGSGQAELEVARLAETTVVVEVPEMGDEIQAIKAGLLEVANVIVVNKADRPGAERSARQLRAMLAGAGGRFAAPPPILLTTATSADGIAALADAIDADRERARSPEQARIRAQNQLLRAIAEDSRRRAERHPLWDATVTEITEHRLDPVTAANQLLGT
jgi:LAO/AO transport system kinase